MSSPPPIKVIKSFYVPGLQFNMHHVTYLHLNNNPLKFFYQISNNGINIKI